MSLTHFLFVTDLPAAPVIFFFNYNVTSVQHLTGQLCCSHGTGDLRGKVKQEPEFIRQYHMCLGSVKLKLCSQKQTEHQNSRTEWGQIQFTFTSCSSGSISCKYTVQMKWPSPSFFWTGWNAHIESTHIRHRTTASNSISTMNKNLQTTKDYICL